MISIHIEAHPDRGNLSQQVEDSLAAIGFSRAGRLPSASVTFEASPASDRSSDEGQNDRVTDQKDPAPAAEPEKKKGGRPKKTETSAPPAPEPEVKAQDAADEAAESTAGQEADAPEVFTRDSVRTIAGVYSTKYGMPAALEDLPGFIGAKNISGIAEDAKAFEAATLAIRAAIDSNPHGREVAKAA